MDARRTNIETEPIWDEEITDDKGELEKKFEGFDPTTMPEPEHSSDLLRKRIKYKDE